MTEVLSASWMLPAIGQGALAVVTREADDRNRELVGSLDHPGSHREIVAERALLDFLEAGCRAPVAGLATTDGDRLHLAGAVFVPDGSRTLREEAEGDGGDAAELGLEVARRLLSRGAAEILRLSRGSAGE